MPTGSEPKPLSSAGQHIMEPIPFPAHIHYELLLQLLERQTTFAVNQQPAQRKQVQQLIATLRKAFSQQKQIEADCERSRLPIEYRWAINHIGQVEPVKAILEIPQEPKI